MGRTGGEVIHQDIEYDPLPSQTAFHALTERFKGFSGPIGCGKSKALCQEAIRLSYMNPGRLGLIGAPTYPMLRDATQAALIEILEGNRIPYEHNKAENTLVMKDTRSRILFRPVDCNAPRCSPASVASFFRLGPGSTARIARMLRCAV
jgi:hypothetical protein